MGGRTLMIVGPSQVGKSASIKELVKHYRYQFVTTCTTRAPRVDETDGRDYDFLTIEKFQQLIRANAFVDWDYFLQSYGGIYRRTFVEFSERPKVLHVLARMALRIEQRHPEATAVFLAPDDLSIVHERIRTAFSNPLVAKARIAHVEEEMLHCSMFRRVIRITSGKTVSEIAAEIDGS